MKSHFNLLLIISIIFISCEEDEPASIKQILTKERINGYVQKGPFIKGTTVLMNELNSKLEQTGKIFTSTITSNLGLFEINNIELSSSFVEFNSTGFYFNEVSGDLSISQLSLSSISDIKDQNSVNVNVLTHLEKKRVENLVKGGKSFSDSKKQSRNELLSIFTMSLSTDSGFEQFDISKNNEEGEILLAISIILQGNRSVAKLTELLSTIQSDFSSDGKLDDLLVLNSLRISTLDLNLEKIRTNVESRYKELNISTSIPNFEKQLAKFLSYKDYRLDIVIEGEGTVESNPSGTTFPYKTLVKLTPIPKEGWIFDSWGGDLSGNENPRTLTIDKDKNFIAKFRRRDYSLNLTIIGEGTVDERIVSNISGRTYPYETVVELTPIPKEGWMFESWTGDLTGSVTPQAIKLDKERNITIKFKKRDYPINITISGEGTVILNPPGLTFPYKTVVELTAIPNQGWVFDSWGGDIIGGENPKTINAGETINITATFKKPIFRIGENGITCKCENIRPGDKGFINGVEYEAVDNNLIRQRRDEKVDMTKLCTSLVTDMYHLFYDMKTFNESISNWDVTNVVNMNGMFGFSSFNQPIGNWNVSSVVDMSAMFAGTPFNQSIGNWNVSKVNDMMFMFNGSQFNQPIGSWDVSNVTNMYGMFEQSTFNQNISKWCVTNIPFEQKDFSLLCPLLSEYKPIWGTCPK